jgi:hypothetical protein
LRSRTLVFDEDDAHLHKLTDLGTTSVDSAAVFVGNSDVTANDRLSLVENRLSQMDLIGLGLAMLGNKLPTAIVVVITIGLCLIS